MFEIAPKPEGDILRDLTAVDLDALGRGAAGPVKQISKIRDSHHLVARLLAESHTPMEASAITGYTTARILQLRNDPTFQELIEFYRQNLNLAARNMAERMESLGIDMIMEIQERLEDKPETFSNAELMKGVALTADRTGYGPRTTQVNVNVNLAERVEAARRRVLDLKIA